MRSPKGKKSDLKMRLATLGLVTLSYEISHFLAFFLAIVRNERLKGSVMPSLSTSLRKNGPKSSRFFVFNSGFYVVLSDIFLRRINYMSLDGSF